MSDFTDGLTDGSTEMISEMGVPCVWLTTSFTAIVSQMEKGNDVDPSSFVRDWDFEITALKSAFTGSPPDVGALITVTGVDSGRVVATRTSPEDPAIAFQIKSKVK